MLPENNTCVLLLKSIFSQFLPIIANCEIIWQDDIRKHTILTHSTYIILKYFTKKRCVEAYITKMRRHKNLILYFPLDCIWNGESNGLSKFLLDNESYDICYANNLSHAKIFNQNTRVFYHPYDPTYINISEDIEKRITYLGGLAKSSLTESLLKDYYIKHIIGCGNEELYNETFAKTIHIDYCLPDHSYYNLHTATKLGTALITKSIFISNKIPVYEELLGNKYPFFFQNDLSNLNEIILKAKQTLNDKKSYEKYLKSVEKAKNILDPTSNSIELEFIESLNGGENHGYYPVIKNKYL